MNADSIVRQIAVFSPQALLADFHLSPRPFPSYTLQMDNERIRAICVALPHVVETVNWGHHLVYFVGDRDIGGKMFAMTDLDGTGARHFRGRLHLQGRDSRIPEAVESSVAGKALSSEHLLNRHHGQEEPMVRVEDRGKSVSLVEGCGLLILRVHNHASRSDVRALGQ